MSNWLIHLPERRALRLGDCDREHAESVFADLVGGTARPRIVGATLVEADERFVGERVVLTSRAAGLERTINYGGGRT